MKLYFSAAHSKLTFSIRSSLVEHNSEAHSILYLRTDTNVLGLLYVTNAAVEMMKEQGSGQLVNIGSLAGHKTGPGVGLFRDEVRRQRHLGIPPPRAPRVQYPGGYGELGAVENELANHVIDEEAKESINALLQLDILQFGT